MESCQEPNTPPHMTNRLDEAIMEWTATFARLWMHDINHFSRETGLTFGQMNLILHIHYHGACEVSGVSDLLQVSPAGASQMVERMVQQGLVRRCEIPEDRRVRRVELTEQGKRMAAGCVESHLKWVRDLADSLDPDRRAETTRLLRELTEKAGKLDLT